MPHDEHIHVKVSIITVVRNAVDVIEPTINSVLGQTYDNVEYIVIDGASTDGTSKIIDRYRDRLAIALSEKDDGIYDALNKGVKMATGDWVGILNAGDLFASDDILSILFKSREALDHVDVLYGDAISVDGTTETLSKAAGSVSELEKGPCYRHGASFVRRETHQKYLFDLTKKPLIDFALDYEQIFRMYKGGVKFRKIDIAIIKYALRGASTASPFRTTYYNHLITHDMKCSFLTKRILEWVTLWRGAFAIINRFRVKKKNDSH